jgi:inosine-uridine nucleoside N-ribohydrolase
VATANLWGDPEAANVVYNSGTKIAQIELDVCNKVEIPLKQQEIVWANNTRATRLLQTITPFKKSANSKREGLPSDDGIHYNDVSAMAYAIDPSLFEFTDLNISIETQSELTRGQTVADFSWTESQPNTSVALEVDSDRLVQLWVERVTRA